MVSRRATRLLLRCMGGFRQGGGEGKGYALAGGWEQGWAGWETSFSSGECLRCNEPCNLVML